MHICAPTGVHMEYMTLCVCLFVNSFVYTYLYIHIPVHLYVYLCVDAHGCVRVHAHAVKM